MLAVGMSLKVPAAELLKFRFEAVLQLRQVETDFYEKKLLT
ncbi:hypothetical protein ACFL6P_03500 [Candidatus Latescibacterota bacterium]